MKPHISRWGGYWRVSPSADCPRGELYRAKHNAFHAAEKLARRAGWMPGIYLCVSIP